MVSNIFNIVFIFLLAGSSSNNKVENNNENHDLNSLLNEFLSCGELTPANTPCNIFLAKALESVYNISDFKKDGDSYFSANEISTAVQVNDKWTSLGKCSDQATLIEAQNYANLGKAVIAVYENNMGHGHVALVIPGELIASGTWGMACPNSASFFLNKANKSYVSKPLSFAFDNSIKADVIIYGRNF